MVDVSKVGDIETQALVVDVFHIIETQALVVNVFNTGCSIMTVKKYLFISPAIIILVTSEGWQNFPNIGRF